MAVVISAADGRGAKVAMLFDRSAPQRPVTSDSEGIANGPVVADSAS
jgi:hypothetical protein